MPFVCGLLILCASDRCPRSRDTTRKPIILQAWLTLPSCLASSSRPTLARMIFCSVVMVSSNAPRPGASPPRPLRARLGSRFAVGTGHLCQIKFWLMQIICANLHVMVYLLNQLNITRVFITNDFVVGDGQL